MKDNVIEIDSTKLEALNPIEQVTRAEADIQISTAKRYPRSLGKVKADIIALATADQETAESCFYTLPRGGKNIQGPSVRLAEIAFARYGNLRAGSRIITVDATGSNPHVVIQAVCHDLETNVALTVEKRRRIVGKKSKNGAIDEDDIVLAVNAGASIAFRDAVRKVIPPSIINSAYEHAKQVAIGDAKTFKERLDRALGQFAKMGIAQDRVLTSINKRSLEEVNLSDLEILFGLFTAIKDGQTTLDEAFPKTSHEVKKPIFGTGTVSADKVTPHQKLHNFVNGKVVSLDSIISASGGNINGIDELLEDEAEMLVEQIQQGLIK
jgi:hypothetical protein